MAQPTPNNATNTNEISAGNTGTSHNAMTQDAVPSAFEQHHQQRQQHQVPGHCINSATIGRSSGNNENLPMNDNHHGLPMPAPRLHHGNILKPARLTKPKSVPDIVGIQGAIGFNGR